MYFLNIRVIWFNCLYIIEICTLPLPSFQCFDAVGWVTGMATSAPTGSPKGFLSETFRGPA